ncbi:leucine-rich repeat-containing protein 70-like [Cydia pomonella]|uniref:leucine-rich repeat-containing protein 70-like n=1 Tax=Cydia pomonella TaxID=82600 RepID=UPI002ADE95ED|nr:leucine-rich repeat-containing protein 70-like [Cydia pomonella]
MRALIVLAFVITEVKIYASICDLCVCRDYSDIEYLGQSVDCSYTKPVLFSVEDSLPNMVYSLDLSSNNLSDVSNSYLYRSKYMKELILSNNKISRIESNVLQLPELIQLDLSNNQLEFIDKDVFKEIRKLEYLNIANNRFTTFTKLAFHRLSNLNQIILDNNNIGPSLRETNLFDRSGFGLTHKIKDISISGINLNTVPDNFFVEAYDLKKLTISNNNLTDIFEIPFTLEYLDLSDNPIEEISNEDFDMPALKILKLNNLAITEVPDYVFTNLHGLEKLELERNRNLTTFSILSFGREVLEDADDFTLEELSLSGSRIPRLDEKLAEPFGQLVKLDLQGNPWICDCNIVWVKKLQIPEKYYDHLRCRSPRPLYNARVFELPDSYFVCAAGRHVTALTVAAVGFCVLLAFIAVWFFIVVPKWHSRGTELGHLHPAAGYTVLPSVISTPL